MFEFGHEIEVAIFERKENHIDFNFEHDAFSNISEDDKQRLRYEAKGTRDNLLFLTNCEERNITYLESVYEWFDDILNIIFPRTELLSLPFFIESNEDMEKFFKGILEWFDFRIKNIKIEEIDFENFDGIPKQLKESIRKDFLNDHEKKE